MFKGDEAFRKAAGHDLSNQKWLQRLKVDGVHTVLTSVVDYKGDRYMAQTVIPGVLAQVCSFVGTGG